MALTVLSQDKTKKLLVEAKEWLFIAISAIPTALVVNKILIPHAIICGGLTGFCEILYFATEGHLSVWLSNLLINAVLIICSFRLIDLKFCIRTIFGVFMLTLWLRIIPIAQMPLLSDPFMAVVLGGIFNGVGLGMIYLNNGTTGGTDIVATLISRYSHFSMGRGLLFCDFLIILSAWLLPQVTTIEQLLFGLCYTFMSTITIDWVMNRVKQSVQFFIFSQKYEEIAKTIIDDVHRGVTLLDGIGAYTHSPIKVIVVLVRKHEARHLINLIRNIDPQAFISESVTEGVFGKGFEPMIRKRTKGKTDEDNTTHR